MANGSKKLEDKLLEFGSVLASPPSSADDLFALLHKIDNHLSRVEQSPLPLTLNALQPLMKELVVKELLRHSDMDVKAAVASCISEITRITAPEAPYDDDTMKEIFQMIVGTFERLDDMSSRSFLKRVSVLETVAKVRSCVVMLDLECDALILEMFQHFIKSIRKDHPESVFVSMETTMKLVIEESEDISSELLACLLNTVKEDNQDVLPIARDLVEKVMAECANKIKPYLQELVKSTGASLGEYSKVVASICEERSTALDTTGPNGTVEALADESKLSERTVSDQHPQVSGKAEQVACPENVDEAEATSPMAANTNGEVQMGNGDSMEQPSSPKQKSERSRRNGQSKSPVAEHISSGHLESMAVKKTKGEKANSVQLTDNTDHSRVDSDKDTPAVTSRRRGRKKEVISPQVDDASTKDVETTAALEPERKSELQHLPASDNQASAVLPNPSEPHVDSSRKKKGRPPGQKAAAKRRDVSSLSDKVSSLSGEKDSHANTPTDATKDDESKKDSQNVEDGEAPASAMKDSQAKKQRNSVKRSGSKRKVVEQESSGRSHKSNKKQQKEDIAPGKDVAGEPGLKDMSSSSPRSTSKKRTRDQTRVEDSVTPKSKSKLKHEIDDIPDTCDRKVKLDKALVGSKVKVFWPDDKKFYNGVVQSFDPKKNAHKIVYDDGDVETLVLEEERWELVDSGADKQTDAPKDEGNDLIMPRVRRAKASSDASSKNEKSRAQSSGMTAGTESGIKDGKRPRGRPRSATKIVSPDTTAPRISRKAKGKAVDGSGGDTPKSSIKSKEGSESQSDDKSLKTCTRQEELGNSKPMEEADALDASARSEETPKTDAKSAEVSTKRRGRKPKKSIANLPGSAVEEGTFGGKPESGTGKLNESITRNVVSSKSEGGDAAGKTPKLRSKGKAGNSTHKDSGPNANGVSGEGKVKAESETNTPTPAADDEAAAATAGTGSRKRKRKSSRK